jgi:TIR domain
LDKSARTQDVLPGDLCQVARNVVFISKATPGDDEFVLWLAPRLEAAGYTVFADILNLEGGTRWRKEVTNTLQTRSIKMLLCCRDSTLAKEGVQEEIGIAGDLVKELSDPKFIIPLRLEPYKKLFGIGELHWVDFVRGWAEGLVKLLDTLRRQKVPQIASKIQINPNWEIYRRREAIPINNEPERLTSNWIRGRSFFSSMGLASHPLDPSPSDTATDARPPAITVGAA